MDSLENLNISSTLSSEPSLTEFVLDFNWDTLMPLSLSQSPQVMCQKTTVEEAFRFIEKNYLKMHESQNAPNATDSLENKFRFYQNMGDFFIMTKERSEAVGLMVAHLSDWSTYYIRYTGLLPSFQKKGLFQTLIHSLIQKLGSKSIDRIEYDISPDHQQQIYLANKMNFIYSGTLLTERWGTLLRYTYYINKHKKVDYINQFCGSS